MGHRLDVDGVALDGRDVAAWAGAVWTGDIGRDWRLRGEQYLAAHPRAGRTGDVQRLAVLRRLAAGPATRLELLAAMRTAAGYVGANDFENRIRDLRGADTRGAGRPGLPIDQHGDVWSLREPFPILDGADQRALSFAKAMIDRLDGPMPLRASSALSRMLPGLTAAAGPAHRARYPASPADLERFHEALEDRRPVRVRYYSLNRDAEGTYTVVPVEYFTLGATVKAICFDVNAYGTVSAERQLALDRLREVETLPDWVAPDTAELRLQRSRIVLQVTSELYRVMTDRNLFDIAAEVSAEQNDEDDSWRVTGSFPTALAWDVMDQLCAWAGNAQVWEPHWLVNAVVRKMAAGLRVMQEGAAFDTVKPEPDRIFASHGDAVAAEKPLPRPATPTKLQPKR